MIRRLLLALPLILIFAPAARPEDSAAAAKKIATALERNRYPEAVELWEKSRTAILGDTSACLAMAATFLEFSKGELARRYREIPMECADAAMACLDAAGGGVPASDKKNRFALARGYLDIADLCVRHGRGKEGVKARQRALGMLNSVVAAGRAPAGAWEQLGRVHLGLVGSDPKTAEHHLAKATQAYGKAAKTAESGPLYLTLGDTRVRLARLLEERPAGGAGARALERSIEEMWEAAIGAYGQGLKLAKGDSRLRTAFNECLWELERLTKGKYRGKPILRPRTLRHGKLRLSMPASTRWQILGESDMSSWNEIFDALREDKRRGRYLRIIVDQYRWKSTFPIPETEEAIKGDDIDGLARRAEPTMRDFFEEVTETSPRKNVAIGTKLPEASAWAMRGTVEGGAAMGYRMIFFKDPRSQFTYQITIIADLETLDRYPHELDCILSTFAPVIRR